ncbi:hypothetical protein [Microbacterium sp. B24]|uniref:hypothetical protein n=1 Tax=Microbacterium sp. B24 TaxID=95616 RepID=UPI0011D26041|nr:hypothetical protein [Microbacterium sp. B24]
MVGREEFLLNEVDAICAENDIPLTDPYSVAMGNADSKGVSDPERSIRLAAEYALEIWNPEVYRSIQQRAREAGRKSKKYTLADHLATAHLNVTAAARTLGLWSSRLPCAPMRATLRLHGVTRNVYGPQGALCGL